MHKKTTYTRSYSQAFSYTHIHEDIQWIYALTDVCLPGFIHFSLMMETPLDASINFASINQRLCFFLAWFKSNCRRLQTFHAGVIGQCHLGDWGKAIKMLFWIVLVSYKQFMLFNVYLTLFQFATFYEIIFRLLQHCSSISVCTICDVLVSVHAICYRLERKDRHTDKKTKKEKGKKDNETEINTDSEGIRRQNGYIARLHGVYRLKTI